MDRRDNAETGYKPAEDHLKKALGVIIESYKGTDPERLYIEAILCFDALIDISLNTETIRDFASRNNIDIKYLVDGANFVISKMHFNPEGNFYVTLGVAQNAGLENIRDRWKRLMLLYHPDRREGGNEWVSERAKKVNEAYTELKDNSRRSAFDRKLVEQAVKVKTAPHHHARTMPSPKRLRSIRPNENAHSTKAIKYLPKVLIVLYLTAAFIFIAFIYYQNDSSSLEKEFLSNHGSTPQLSQETGDKELKFSKDDENIHETSNATNKDINFKSDVKDPLTDYPSSRSLLPKTDKISFQSGTPNSPAPPSHDLQEKSFSVQQEKEKIHSSKDITQKQTPVPLIASSTVTSMNSSLKKEDAQPKPPEERYGPQEQKNVKPHTENQRTVTQALVQEGKTESVHTMSSQKITKDEVEVFIQKYITSYRENDLNKFMSLFSPSAVENNKADYNDIQKAYKETFTKKIHNYNVQDMNISIENMHALVTGSYQLNRYISSEDRWVKFSGNIRWKLAKENNILKIMSINYDK